jgi:hypothetical protein
MLDLFNNHILAHVKPPGWPDHDYSFVWLYAGLIVMLYFAFGQVAKKLAHRQVYNPARVSKHSETLRKIREKQQEEMLKQLEESKKQAIENTQEENKEDKIEEKPAQNPEDKPRRVFFEETGKKSGGTGYRPSIKDRYPKMCGPRGG